MESPKATQKASTGIVTSRYIPALETAEPVAQVPVLEDPDGHPEGRAEA
jgi:hypothetical protein